MTFTKAEVSAATRAFLLERVIPGESPDRLDDTTPLISGGVLDSVSILQLASFLEDRYGVEIEPYELTPEHFETLPEIAELICSKAG